MELNLQIICLIFSFLYGMAYYFSSLFNKYIIEKTKNIYKVIITFIFVLNLVIIYLIVLYKINNGIFHVYFLLFFLLGFFISVKIRQPIVHFFKKLAKKNF